MTRQSRRASVDGVLTFTGRPKRPRDGTLLAHDDNRRCRRAHGRPPEETAGCRPNHTPSASSDGPFAAPRRRRRFPLQAPVWLILAYFLSVVITARRSLWHITRSSSLVSLTSAPAYLAHRTVSLCATSRRHALATIEHATGPQRPDRAFLGFFARHVLQHDAARDHCVAGPELDDHPVAAWGEYVACYRLVKALEIPLAPTPLRASRRQMSSGHEWPRGEFAGPLAAVSVGPGRGQMRRTEHGTAPALWNWQWCAGPARCLYRLLSATAPGQPARVSPKRPMGVRSGAIAISHYPPLHSRHVRPRERRARGLRPVACSYTYSMQAAP